MKRLFLDIDETPADVLETNQRLCSSLSTGTIEDKFFDEVLDSVGYRMPEAWEAVKQVDEIYIDTALISSYFGMSSPLMFNNLLYKAIKEGVTGKRIYIMREYGRIQWGELKKELVAKAFVNNEIYVYNDGSTAWIKVDIESLLEEL